MTPTPIVRLTLEHMKYEIAHMVDVHLDEMREAIEHAVTSAVARYDLTGEIEQLAWGVIHTELERAIKAAVTDAIWTDSVRKALAERAAEVLALQIRKMP
jgi:hypothetical protein